MKKYIEIPMEVLERLVGFRSRRTTASRGYERRTVW